LLAIQITRLKSQKKIRNKRKITKQTKMVRLFRLFRYFSFVSYFLLVVFPYTAGTQTPAPISKCFTTRPVPIDRWRGEYFNNRDLSGTPAMIRDDGVRDIDFDWRLESPSQDCNVNADQFSVRWTRTTAFASGAYRFTITADDGVRLFVDGEEKFSHWASRPMATNTIDVAMTPGNHKITLEYFENFGSAAVQLKWQQNPCNTPVAADHWKGEYFNNDNLNSQPVMVRDDGDRTLFFEWQEQSPSSACGIKEDLLSVRWSRKVVFGTGAYRFELQAADGARIFIDGQQRFEGWRSQSPIQTYFDLTLGAGNHQIIVEFRHAGRQRAFVSLNWKPLPCLDSVDPAHWRGEYFNSDNLSGQKVMVRDDGDSLRGIDFNWEDSSPSAGCNVRDDSFSVRWTGTPSFNRGVHRFTLTAKGGVKLLIDGQLKIDQWAPNNQKHSVDVELTPGPHKVVLEFADFGGKSFIKLSWQPPPCISTVPTDHWRGEYFSNKNLGGRPSIIRDEGTGPIDFDWGLNTPNRDCLANQDGFSARWSRTVAFAAGSYRFSVTGDDGVRLLIDGKLLIDGWRDQSAKTQTADIELNGGPHRLVLEYYENVGSASVKLSWTGAPCTAVVSADRWKGEFFNNPDLKGKPAVVRDDGDVRLDFDWGLGGPDSDCGIDVDNFSARWTRVFNFGEGIFRFTVTADDGVRIYIDRHLKFERWVDQSTTHVFDLQLAAGNHEITVEYFERWGSAVLKLGWERNPCFQFVQPEHWRVEYFNNPNLSGEPVMVRGEPEIPISKEWLQNSPNSSCNLSADNFSARWTRKVVFAPGLYRFTATGDDGVRLFINGKKVIDEWRNQGRTEFNTTIYLPQGSHLLVFEFFEQTGDAVALLSWQQIGKAR
jgi:PA14 domain